MRPLVELVERPHNRSAAIIGVAAFVLLAHQVALACPQDDPGALQQRGIERVGQYINNFRRTGDRQSLLPQVHQAQGELMASYDAFVARGDWAAAALSALTLGDIERMQNRWDPAIALYGRARDLAGRARHPGYQARALTGLARTGLLGGGNLSAAIDQLTEAIRLATEAANTDYLFDALDFAAEVEVRRGNLAAASAYLDRGVAMGRELDDKSRLLYGYLNRADIYLKRAEKCDYERTFDVCYEALNLARADYEQVLRFAQDLGFTFLAQQARDFLRETEQRQALIQSRERMHKGISEAALFHPKQFSDVGVNEHFVAGAASAAEIGQIEAIRQQYAAAGVINSAEPRGAYIEGMSQELRGNNDSALAAFLRAVDLLERDRRGLRDEQSRGTFLEDKIDLYYAPMLQLLERRRLAEAFRLLERSRSHAMADLLASRTPALGSAQERELFSTSLKLRANIAAAQQKLFGLVATGGREKHADEIAALEAQIGTGEGEYQMLQERMAKDVPRLADLVVSEPVTLESAQRAAGAGGYDLLYYVVLEHALILWDINGTEVRVWNVVFPRTEVMKHVAALRDNLTDRERNEGATFDEQTSRELFLFLIQPALKSIRTHHLVILPHEDLNALPFQVLQNPVDGTYLGERFQISYAPSASVLAALQPKPNLAAGRLLALADPGISDAVAEVKAIGQLYPGRSKVVGDLLVSKGDVIAWAGNYSLLHLSVHGKFDVRDPLLSYLAFRSTASDDGHLTAAEMFGLPLPKNALVVLSACETGRVEATHANEVVGMVRALVYAGASEVVLSLWQVQSQATALWMETFYREAQTNPPSEAARLALRAVKARPEYRHPYFWGPFVMTGK